MSLFKNRLAYVVVGVVCVLIICLLVCLLPMRLVFVLDVLFLPILRTG
ncbi:protein of unknown function [Shewanella benthica]|uniref:Uncharacterized protein n=1 Tax=Shewanella benthica TaxID=43661 RepID=A0A330M6G0_9GAMM|nr:protein of unknown function [Shewanella benthica]